MKRKKPLKRTPLKRSAKPMRRQSKKRQAQYRAVKDIRADYRESYPRCFICGQWYKTVVHEIANGMSARSVSEAVPATWLPPCSDCNTGPLEDKKLWPVAKQLCLKKRIDPVRYDLEKFNFCYTHGSIHQEDVDAYEDEITELIGSRFPQRCPVCGALWQSDYMDGGIGYQCGSVLRGDGEWFTGRKCKEA